MFQRNICWIGHCGNPRRRPLFADYLHFLINYRLTLGTHHLCLQDLAVLSELKSDQYESAKNPNIRGNLEPAGKSIYIH
jgi:hypothetical protein